MSSALRSPIAGDSSAGPPHWRIRRSHFFDSAADVIFSTMPPTFARLLDFALRSPGEVARDPRENARGDLGIARVPDGVPGRAPNYLVVTRVSGKSEQIVS